MRCWQKLRAETEGASNDSQEAPKPRRGEVDFDTVDLGGVEAERHLELVAPVINVMNEARFLPAKSRKLFTAKAGDFLSAVQSATSALEVLLLVKLAVEQRIDMKVGPYGEIIIKPASKSDRELRVKPCSSAAPANCLDKLEVRFSDFINQVALKCSHVAFGAGQLKPFGGLLPEAFSHISCIDPAIAVEANGPTLVIERDNCCIHAASLGLIA